ncbi:MAG: hypothetical protein U0931_42330, partial [Vulcanimicrobiota bacterium]
GLYSLACWHFFDTPIHRYYARRPLMTGLPDFSQQMFGILFSPGVGLFVFQPLLILPFILGPLYLRRNALFWCLYAQVLLHLVLVALQTDWWGGSTYGSRLTAETIVPLSCIAVMLGLPGRPWLRPFLLVGLAWSIWVNLWCAYFRFDSHPQWPPSFYTRESNRRVLWDWKLAPFWVTARQAQEFRNRSVKELFSNLTQPQFHLGWNVDQRPDGQRYITPLRDTDLSFLSTAASGVQSGAFVFRYAAPAPVAVRLNGSAWTVLPASPEVIDRCVFFKERAWGASTRLSFSQASGLQLYDLDVQNWDPHEPGGLIYGEGWGRDEELSEKSSFRWCFGPESRLRLVCTRPGPMRLIWRGQSPKAGTSLEVRLNGQPRAHFARLSTEEQGYQLDLEVPTGLSSLEFRFNQWGSSWGGDPRPLALSFRDLRLIPNAVK